MVMPNDVTLWKKSMYKWPLSSCDHNIQSSKSKMYLAAIIYKDKDLHSFLGNLHPCEYDTWFYNPPKINPFVPNALGANGLMTLRLQVLLNWSLKPIVMQLISSQWQQQVNPWSIFDRIPRDNMLTCCNMLLERASSHRFVNNSPRA